MNYLKHTSRIEERYHRVRADIGLYWMDKLADHLKSQYKEKTAISGIVIAVLRDPLLGRELVVPGMNIVTNDGDQFYAQAAASETPTDDFPAGGFRLGTAATAPTKADTDVTTEDAAGRKAIDATYPRTADPDGDNTGAGVDIVTWRVSYTTAEAIITGIQEGAIVDNTTTPTAALTHFLFAASFNKTASDTLKVFVNSEFLGV